jgi:hypothetical protein
MKFGSLILVAVAPAAVVAIECRHDLDYCGHDLLTMGMNPSTPSTYNTDIYTTGDWLPDIDRALNNAGISADKHAVEDSLFTCVGDYQIELNKICPKTCVDSRVGVSDACRD